MDEYSIETKSENIFDRKTKEYFLEVVSSYHQGNYRSATVMLWSVAICDLLYKLKQMHDMYGDTIAKGILDEVERIQTGNPRSSEWEFKLVELISDRTNLLEMSDIDHLTHLQQQRHLSAHPVLSSDLELHRPNKDTVRSLIRNTLDGILTKPPIYTRKVFDDFVADIAASSSILIKDETLKSYLESKYLSRADKKLEQNLIRSLWKLVFRLQNPDCDKNRNINYRAMELLISRNSGEMAALIRSARDYFSHIANTGEPIVYLVSLLSQYPSFYSELTEAARVIINHVVETNLTAKCMGWFIKPSLNEHANDLIAWLSGDESPDLPDDAIPALRNLSDSPEWDSHRNRILNAYYGASWSYDKSDERFSSAIKPYIEQYTNDDLVDLLNKIEANGQTYERRGARGDHRIIKERCDNVLGASFDYTPYPHFTRSIE
ncbi:MAG: hypothetical protein ABW101_05085 [Candidatus Thiodiazotropha sp.]